MTILRHGDRSQDVRVLQQRLNQAGAVITKQPIVKCWIFNA